MVVAYIILLLLVGAERLVELFISKRNAKWAFDHGGFEVGKGHFPFMAFLHTALLFGCGLEVLFLHRPFIPALGYPMLALAIGCQILRYYVIATLGKSWNVRVIIVPGRQVVQKGLYKYLRHPNYFAVIVEGFALPLIHTAWLTALIFTILNAALLMVRIRCEEQALMDNCDYKENFSYLKRFTPFGKKEGMES